MRSFDRPTHRFVARYYHDGAWWGADIYAYDFADAEARCKALNMKLDGLYVATIPCAPATGWLTRLICWVRNTIARSNTQ
jgi:hypothetical protein